jgi:hypothetical protein
MIKNLTAGPGVRIINNSSNWPSFYNTAIGTGNTLVGQVRYNGSTQNMEVYDGASWLTMLGAYPQVELNDEVHSILDWAREKMSEEKRIKELAKTNLKHYLDTVGETNNTMLDTSAFQNYYCDNQKQNPHTPKVMASLGLKEDDIAVFIQDCLFPEIH